MTYINCPNVTYLGNGVFAECDLLGGDVVFNSLPTMVTGYLFTGTKITSFTGNNVTKIAFGTFAGCTQINYINIPLVSSMGDSNTAIDDIFTNIKTGCTITVPIEMQTINGGEVEPDLQYAITSRGATVNYV